MKKYLITFSKSLKAELSYRSAMLAGIASALLGFVIQLFLWQALLGTGIRQDTSFPDMVLYILINSFMLELTRSNVATTIETAMIDGTVSMELLRPMSYKYYQQDYEYTAFKSGQRIPERQEERRMARRHILVGARQP